MFFESYLQKVRIQKLCARIFYDNLGLTLSKSKEVLFSLYYKKKNKIVLEK